MALTLVAMTAMEWLVPGLIWSETEFTHGEGATCGDNAYAMAKCWANQRYLGNVAVGEDATWLTYLDMLHARTADPGGASNGAGIYAQALADKYRADHVRTFRNAYAQETWLPDLLTILHTPAVAIVEIAAGHNLRDANTGMGEDAGPTLAFHWVLVVGYHPGGYSKVFNKILPAGVYACDGDSDVENPIVAGARTRLRGSHALQFYTLETFNAARPCDIVALHPRVALPSGSDINPPGGGAPRMLDLTHPIIARFYKKNAQNLVVCMPTGKTLGPGFTDDFLTYSEANADLGAMTAFGMALSNEIYLPGKPGTAIVVYERRIRVYDPQRTIDAPPGAQGAVYDGHLNLIPDDALAAVKAQLAVAQTQVAAYQRRVSAAQAALIAA